MRTLRILLVEDDHDHVFLIRRALADLDDVAVAIEVAGDAQQAVEGWPGRASRPAAGPS